MEYCGAPYVLSKKVDPAGQSRYLGA